MNLYLALFSLLTSKKVEGGKLELPQSYSQAVEKFGEHIKDSKYQEVDKYYQKIFEHELREFEDHFTEWESSRVY